MNARDMAASGASYVFCRLPFQQIKVDAKGYVSMCCYQKEVLGNLLERDIAEIWNGPLAQEIRRTTREGRLHSMCEGWGACPFIVSPKTPTEAVADELAPPLSLELDLPNTHCNIGGIAPKPDTACIMCPRSDAGFVPHADRSREIAEKLRPLMPRLAEIRVLGLAEPFWKDKVFEVLDWMGFAGHRQRCHFNTFTNGSVFTAERRRKFVEACPNSRLLFSIDAATAETYIRIRRLDLFERVKENIRAFVRERGRYQLVAISNNLNELNLHEAPAMLELASSLGVEDVLFNPTHTGGIDEREDLAPILVSKANAARFAEVQRQLARRALELGIQVTFVRPLDLGITAGATAREPALSAP